LVAQWWAEFSEVQPTELAFYHGCILRFGQPALDLACGTGRLLIPLLQVGLDVDGCDLSEDMLVHCRAKAAQAGLTTALYAQPMHDFALPRRYRTIFICDSFGIRTIGLVGCVIFRLVSLSESIMCVTVAH
jgi:2-polyprenyl-3-methyl-5-hydroxy-6-metoxy-1,4-benzoquinol methylase